MSLTRRSAQQPPRPNETPRAVTLSLAEYNRLIDLASRPPQGAVGRAGRRGAGERRSSRARRARHGARRVQRGRRRAARRRQPREPDVGRHAHRRERRRHGRCRSSPTATRIRRCCRDRVRSRSRWNGARRCKFTPGRASFVLPVPPSGTARATIRSAGRSGRRPPVGGTRHAPIDRRTAGRSSRRRSIPARRPRCGGRCATARPRRPLARCARSPT